MSQKDLEYNIQSITVTNFNIDLKQEFLKYVKENPEFNQYTVEINSGIKGFIEVDIVNIEIYAKIFLDKEKKVELGSIKVQNNFEVKGINEYYNKTNNTLELPNKLNEILITISTSHTRGIFMTKCAGTFLSNALIPIINPKIFLPPINTNPNIKI